MRYRIRTVTAPEGLSVMHSGKTYNTFSNLSMDLDECYAIGASLVSFNVHPYILLPPCRCAHLDNAMWIVRHKHVKLSGLANKIMSKRHKTFNL